MVASNNKKRIWEKTQVEPKGSREAGPVSQSRSTVNVLQPKTTRNILTVSLLVATRESVHHEELWDFSIKEC